MAKCYHLPASEEERRGGNSLVVQQWDTSTAASFDPWSRWEREHPLGDGLSPQPQPCPHSLSSGAARGPFCSLSSCIRFSSSRWNVPTSYLFQRSVENSPLVKGPFPSLCCSESPIASFLIVCWELRVNWCLLGSQVVLVVKKLPANVGDSRDVGLILELGRYRGEEHGNPLQDSRLENPRDGGAWWATVQRVAKSRTQLKRVNTCRVKRTGVWPQVSAAGIALQSLSGSPLGDSLCFTLQYSSLGKPASCTCKLVSSVKIFYRWRGSAPKQPRRALQTL